MAINMSELKDMLRVTLATNRVPCILGEAGIGKSEIVKQFADENDMKFFLIEGGGLKDGELCGLPYVSNHGNSDRNAVFTKFYNIAKKEEDIEKVKKTFYSAVRKLKQMEEENSEKMIFVPYPILKELEEYHKENPDKKILLFIDELNRAERQVYGELMNFIITRSINGYHLPDEVKLVAAGNPSSQFSEFANSTYQVNDLDNAQKDRFRWFFVKSDSEVWLDWATKKDDEGKSNINYLITDFIATFPQNLHVPDSQDDVYPTPRSWKFLSDTLDILTSKELNNSNFIFNIAQGDVGSGVGMQFTNFIFENKNPILKPKEIFDSNYTDGKEVDKTRVSKEVEERFINETAFRKQYILMNCVEYMKQFANKKTWDENMGMKYAKLFTEDKVEKDIMAAVMKKTMQNYRIVHERLTQKYSNGQLNIYTKVFIDTATELGLV